MHEGAGGRRVRAKVQRRRLTEQLGRQVIMNGIGMLGCGIIAQHLLDGIKRSGGDLVAVCDRDEALAAETAKQWGGTAYADVDAFVADEAVAGVVVALPSDLHYAFACQALEAGKHVFCEKPMTTRVEDSLDLLRRAEASGRAFQMGYMKRFHPAYGALKGLLEGIGPIYSASVQLTLNGLGWQPLDAPQDADSGTWHWNLARAGGGFLTHSGSHLIDLIQFLFGTPRCAWGRVLIDGGGNEYNTNVLLTTDHDTPVHLDMRYVAIEAGSTKQTPWDERVEVVGQNGRILAEGYDWQGKIPCRLRVETPEQGAEEFERDATLQWVDEFKAFQQAMAGEATFASSAADGCRVDVMLESLRSLGPSPRLIEFDYASAAEAPQ